MTLREFFKEAAKSPATAQMAVGGVAVTAGVATGNAWVAAGVFVAGAAAGPCIAGYISRRLG